MKKYIAILLAMAMALLCCACGTNSDGDIAVLTYRLEQAENHIAELEERINKLENTQMPVQSNVVEKTAEEQEPEEEQETETPAASQPSEILSDAQTLLVESLKEYKNSAAYIKCAKDESRIELQFATEYRISDLGGHKLHVILASVDADRDVYGIDVGNVVIDMNTGVLYHNKTLDVDNYSWDNMSSYEDALTGILAAFGSWTYFERSEPFIMSETEYRDDFTAEQISTINEMLN